MKDPFDRVDEYAEALLRGRRPHRFRVPSREDADALRMAAALAAESSERGPNPSPEFLQRLRSRVVEGAREGQPSSRRGFIAAALAGLAAGLGAGFGLGRNALGTAQPGGLASSGGSSIVRENGRWFTVARLSQLGDSATLRFSAGALEGHLVKRGSQLAAVSAICSHLPCSLVYRPGDEDFLCPCHEATFHLDGEQKVARRPYPPLTRFEAKVEGDDVLVWSIDRDAPTRNAGPPSSYPS